jgi:ABC-type transport system involved in multi-copper enzyme maturation permease subunit
MKFWHSLENRNPVLVEARQAALRMMGVQNLNASTKWNVIMVGVIFAGITALAMRYPTAVEPVVTLPILLTILNFILPVVLHSVIAKEREKRSMDILLSCPVTPMQIVVGKLARGIPWVVLVSVLLLAPTFGALLMRAIFRHEMPDGTYALPVSMLLALMLLLTSAFWFASITVWVSSMAKKTHGALLGSLGVFFVVLLVLPAVMTILGANNGYEVYHPYVALSLLFADFMGNAQKTIGPWYCMGIQIVSGVIVLFLAGQNVGRDYREGDRRLSRA